MEGDALGTMVVFGDIEGTNEGGKDPDKPLDGCTDGIIVFVGVSEG